ncbi:hypothetical protein WJX73_009398 [Symbiochloris irregularis]|uniref:DNA-directed RNA polymerase subunit beta n=1 Tax=Symbiochloris irregularis TaxID=706552 RepID=A0AAW1NUI6_9CHLO
MADGKLRDMLAADSAKLHAPIKDVRDKYELLPAFLRTRGLVNQHIDSYNWFVNQELRNIVTAKANQRVTSEADKNFYLEYKNVTVGTPILTDETGQTHPMNPQQCRLRDLTYAAPIKVDVDFIKGSHHNVVSRSGRHAVDIGRLPLMLRSDRCVLRGKNEAELAKQGECPLDPGGYFIVKGTEKVILIQEQLSKNRVLLNLDRQGNIEAHCTSYTTERKVQTNMITRHGRLLLAHSAFKEAVNVAAVLKAMGVESDQEILALTGCTGDSASLLMPTLQECKALHVFTTQQALEYLGSAVKRTANHSRNRPRLDEARDILASMILCHVPVVRYDFADKARFIGLMVKRVVYAMLVPDAVDDRDYYGNKRLELAGSSLALLFEDLFKLMSQEMRKQADAHLQKAQARVEDFDISRCIRSDIITLGLESAISSGNWTIKRFRMDRRGMTQVLNRLSFIASLGMMTRICSQFEKTRKVSGPRALQPSQWGMLCPVDTPEGESCGLDKHLALLTHVTVDEPLDPIKRLALALGVQPGSVLCAAQLHAKESTTVWLDGNLLGIHQKPKRFVSMLRKLRRGGRLGRFVSVHTHRDGVHIAADGGRVCRPLIVCNKGIPLLTAAHVDKVKAGKLTFANLLDQGILEYIDVNEENDSLVALYERDCTPPHTHVEIEPFTVLGIVSGLIPFPHHNQSPRNTYQCAMGKQAMGSIAYNQNRRMDTLMYLLTYPQRPLLTTKTIQLTGFDRLGAGQNATVAVMSYSGYDIEDALVMNKASLDRGFGRCMLNKKANTVLRSYPNRTKDQLRGANAEQRKHRLLEEDGLCCPGQIVNPGDTYINKETPVNTRDTLASQGGTAQLYKASPMGWKGVEGELVVVDKVMIANNDEGSTVLKVLMRHTRRPEIGDKFSSRHGQKGVVGNIVPQADMPFTDSGICPDLIMNPHGFPSRMTVGKMIELLGSKAAVLDGKFKFGTAFGEGAGLADNVGTICQALVAKGFSYSGKDTLTSGITGEPLEACIFMGPVYYQKLKHMVVDKLHARATGPKMLLTRQPTEGRARDGGLRLGEMERDCLIAYGASALLLERLMISSDQFTVHVCTHCGLLGYYDLNAKMPVCPSTKRSDAMATLRLPYACKLMLQELQAMNIVPRLQLSPA